MLGSRNKPVVFNRGYSRRRNGVPKWLQLLLGGIALGVFGFWFAQEKLLPQRLSIGESRRLQADFDKANNERSELKAQLATTTTQLQAAQASVQKQAQELVAPRAEAQKLRGDLDALIGALPVDPRGGAIEVRAARFAPQAKGLGYDVILTRAAKDAATQPFKGTLQFEVLGLTPRGAETRVTLKPVDFSMPAHTLLRGTVAVPEGVRPSQVTLRVLDSPNGKMQGMRVMYVR
jgi:hypothetical protein